MNELTTYTYPILASVSSHSSVASDDVYLPDDDVKELAGVIITPPSTSLHLSYDSCIAMSYKNINGNNRGTDHIVAAANDPGRKMEPVYGCIAKGGPQDVNDVESGLAEVTTVNKYLDIDLKLGKDILLELAGKGDIDEGRM